MLPFLNFFFFAFHTAFTLFNVVGWIFRITRKWHLATMTLTALSWFVLGIWYGWGYCVCTDWHWDIREKLGYHDEQRSYIHFLIVQLTGMRISASLVDNLVLVVFIASFVLSVILNVRDRKKKVQEV
jgi:hypothetical protein